MKAFYGRVSTEEQNLARQTNLVEVDIEYFDKESGMNKFATRKEGSKLMKDIKKGKITSVVVKEVDRLGRDLIDILKTIDFFVEHKCQLKILDQGIELLNVETLEENEIFRMIVGILGSIANLEYKRSKRRQREGIERAQKEGAYENRKTRGKISVEKRLENNSTVVKLIEETNLSNREISKTTGKSLSTVFNIRRILKEQALKKVG